jgi:hypothetical protein
VCGGGRRRLAAVLGGRRRDSAMTSSSGCWSDRPVQGGAVRSRAANRPPTRPADSSSWRRCRSDPASGACAPRAIAGSCCASSDLTGIRPLAPTVSPPRCCTASIVAADCGVGERDAAVWLLRSARRGAPRPASSSPAPICSRQKVRQYVATAHDRGRPTPHDG